MSWFPDKDIIEEVAIFKEIEPVFVEKDWYATQVISKINEYHYKDFQILFTGGTSLSKCHNLISRMSEDLDYRVIAPNLETETKNHQSRILSLFKKDVIDHLKTTYEIEDKRIFARNGNRFFSLELFYPTFYPQSNALRPHLLIEFTVTDLVLPILQLPASSFINELSGRPGEIEQISCVNPVEIAADKLSALIWRIPARKRGQDNDDPDIVRHLHDLSKLYDLVIKHKDFKRLSLAAITMDDSRSKIINGLSVGEKFKIVSDILHQDMEYPKEYDRFVKGMSYASASLTPSFSDAESALQRLMKYILN